MSASCSPSMVAPFSQMGAYADIESRITTRQWYAVFTVPQNEKSVARQFQLREIESFLPTYETERIWKNRQRVNLTLPLFPSYIFARIGAAERSRVLQSPGVVRIVGNSKEPIPVPDAVIQFLRSGLCDQKIAPYNDLVVGTRVRVKSGPMRGLQGVLVRRNNSFRFVVTIEMINQHAAVEIVAANLEPITE